MPSRRIVAVQVTANLACGGQQLVLLGMEFVMASEQDVAQLPGRDVDTQFTKMLQKSTLGDMVLVRLQQNELT